MTDVVLVRAVMTSMACPAQWDAWDADGNYYYLRFRHGFGSVVRYPNENWVDDAAAYEQRMVVTTFEYDSDNDRGWISLEEFADRAGLGLAGDLLVTGFGDHIRDRLVMDHGMSLDDATQVSEPWRALDSE